MADSFVSRFGCYTIIWDTTLPSGPSEHRAGPRGRGVGRSLILAVYEAARAAGSSRVYWQTQATNAAGRALYDKLAAHHGFIVYSHEL